jgi:transcriptional regulator with XRE-family HTH domain
MLMAMKSIGGNIRRLREKAGFATQKAFSQALGWHQSRTNELENDRYALPDLDTLMHVATTLRCGLDELLLGANPAYDTQRAMAPKDAAGRVVVASGEDERDLLQAYREAEPDERPMVIKFARSLKATQPAAPAPPAARSSAPSRAGAADAEETGRGNTPRVRRAGGRR